MIIRSVTPEWQRIFAFFSDFSAETMARKNGSRRVRANAVATEAEAVADRLTDNSPNTIVASGVAFESVGVDCFGPVEVAQRPDPCRKLHRVYVALFMCMKSKRIHLDFVTDAFLACFSRFISVRGRPNEIFSDNATIFHGVSSGIRAIHAHWAELAIMSSIKWTFVTPPSPGGNWERAVRIAKHYLSRAIDTQILTYEEYARLLENAASYMNRRPGTSI